MAGIEDLLRKRLPASREAGFALVDEFIAEYSESDLAAVLQKSIGQPRPFAPLHTAVARLAGAGVCPILFTTNYDRLIENALTEARVDFVSQSLEDNFTVQNLEEVQVLKLHGDAGDWQSAILSAASYQAFEASYPRLVHQLDLNLRTRPVIFVGCSMSDPRLLDWLGALPIPDRKDLYASRAILTQEEWLRLPDPKRHLLASANVKPILVPDHESVTRLLQEIARRLAPADPGELVFELHPGEKAWTVVGPTPESTPHTIPNPLGDAGLVELLGKLRESTGVLVPLDHPEAAAMEAALHHLASRIGERLTPVLLSDEARAVVVRRMNQRERGRARLTVRVRNETSLGDRALALPWELIAPEPGTFPVRDGRLDLVHEAVAEGAPELPEPSGPLTVAVAIAAPEDQAALDYEKEAFRLQSALSPLGQRVAFAELGGFEDLVEVVEGQRAAAVHFSGHGLPGQLVFEDEDGFADPVPVTDLLSRLNQALGKAGSFPRLFFLASCHGATGSSDPIWTVPEPADVPRQARGELDTVLGRGPSTAAALHRSGFALVTGYFGPVGDELCTRAEEAFYETLAEGGTALQAVAVARTTLSEPLERDGPARYPLGWAQLAVYLRGPDRPLAERGEPGSDDLPARFRRKLVEVSGLPVLKLGFIGRRALQHRVRRLVRGGQRLIVLQGLGGLGKTALASQLVSRVLTPDPQDQLILRCRGLDESTGDPVATLRAQAEEHGRVLGLPNWDERMKDLRERVPAPSPGFAETIRQLRRERPRLVLYADNAESLQEGPETGDLKALGSWRPEAQAWWKEMESLSEGGLVLVSTRYAWPDLEEDAWFPVGPMTPSDVLRLIDSFDTLSRLPRAVRTRLAQKADGHPRTVEFLDILVAEQRRSLGLGAEITDPWVELIEPILGKHAEKISSDLLLGALWDRLSPAAREHAGKLSVLRIAAPRFVIDQLGSAVDELIRTGVLTLYRERGVEEGEPVWVDRWGLHSLVKNFVDGKLTEAERRDAHLAAGEAFEELAKQPEGWWKDQIAGIHHLHRVREGDRAWPMVQKYVLWLRDRARYREARALLEACEAAETSGDRLAKALMLTASMRQYLGENSSELAQLLTRALSLAGSDQTRSYVLSELGSLREEQGEYTQAEALLREALALIKVELGRECLEYGACLHGLAGVLTSEGKYIEAEAMYHESLAIKEKMLGTGHHEYGTSLHGLAGVLSHQKRHTEAEGLLRKALAIDEKVLGTDHPLYGGSLHSLAVVLYYQGKYAEAEVLFRKSLSITQKELGIDHPSLSPTLTSLAGVLAQQGRAEEGEPLIQRALEISLRVFGPASPDAAGVLNILAQLQAHLGRPECAVTAQQALEALEAALGSDHPTTREVAPILHRISSGAPVG